MPLAAGSQCESAPSSSVKRISVFPAGSLSYSRRDCPGQNCSFSGSVTAEQIQAELDLALAMRQASSPNAASPGPGGLSPAVAVRGRLDRLTQVQLAQAARAFPGSGASAWHTASQQASRRVVPVGRVIQIRDADLHSELLLLTYAQTPDGARFTTTIGTHRSPGIRGPKRGPCRQPQRRPRQFTATDDQGATYHLSFRAGSRAGVIELQPGAGDRRAAVGLAEHRQRAHPQHLRQTPGE